MLAGRDLAAGGTWLAVDRQRRFAVVTNYREAPAARAAGPSRGRLITDYLAATLGPQAYLESLAPVAADYAGFNILCGDAQQLCYASNRAAQLVRPLAPGVYGLSNRLLDTPWPKLTRVRHHFEAWLRTSAPAPLQELMHMLADRTPSVAGEAYPADLAPEWRRALSAPFVQHPVYGTRCSSVVLIAADGGVRLLERRFDAAGECSGETEIALDPAAWPQ